MTEQWLKIPNLVTWPGHVTEYVDHVAISKLLFFGRIGVFVSVKLNHEIVHFQSSNLNCPWILSRRHSGGEFLLVNFIVSVLPAISLLIVRHRWKYNLFLPWAVATSLLICMGSQSHFFPNLVNFVGQVQVANKQTALMTLGIYLRNVKAWAFHLSSKLPGVTFHFTFNLM